MLVDTNASATGSTHSRGMVSSPRGPKPWTSSLIALGGQDRVAGLGEYSRKEKRITRSRALAGTKQQPTQISKEDRCRQSITGQ